MSRQIPVSFQPDVYRWYLVYSWLGEIRANFTDLSIISLPQATCLYWTIVYACLYSPRQGTDSPTGFADLHPSAASRRPSDQNDRQNTAAESLHPQLLLCEWPDHVANGSVCLTVRGSRRHPACPSGIDHLSPPSWIRQWKTYLFFKVLDSFPLPPTPLPAPPSWPSTLSL